MKFAKELERDLVPEWRAKYFNYKLGKKKIKAIQRAVKSANSSSPGTPRFLRGTSLVRRNTIEAPQHAFLNRNPFTPSKLGPNATKDDGDAQNNPSAPTPKNIPQIKPSDTPGSLVISRQRSRHAEQTPLKIGKKADAPDTRSRMTRYGSIIGSPPKDRSPAPISQQTTASSGGGGPPSLRLPGPALSPEEQRPRAHTAASNPPSIDLDRSRQLSTVPSNPEESAYEAGKTVSPARSKINLATRHLSVFHPKRIDSIATLDSANMPRTKRYMSFAGTSTLTPRSLDVPLEAYREVDLRQADFFNFLDNELDKIEGFYKQKEDEAKERLKVLRDQLHIMRDRRVEELVQARNDKTRKKSGAENGGPLNGSGSDEDEVNIKHGIWDTSWLRSIDKALETVDRGLFGRKTKAMEQMATPNNPRAMENTWNRDYVRRAAVPRISYRTAKRKLKLAMQEFYRGLELLKSYSLLNRTAFRKINKKYDKLLNVRPALRYMSEKVDNAWFVKSTILDDHIRDVEDLYARYFEGGNRKIAASKLRIKVIRPEDYTPSVLRNGLMLGAGLVFAVQALVYGANLLSDPDPTIATQTSYLMQLYGGYFMMLLLVLLFCAACKFWTINKVNYVFVFEFDTRHHLDWRQLFELPCFFFFLMCFTMWINFTRYGSDAMYIYWPVLLVGITAIVLFFPAPILYRRTRGWFLYSMFRLSFAGFYPVEFRDFFLGDMFCSETYSMGNIEVFFCLYAQYWSNPALCNSSHSRLLGFFSTLPGIWRFLQCIRRFIDTRNVFPHLANCGKYSATVLYYMSLSLFRMNKTFELKAVFIFFAAVNSVYCTIWDVVMDWSLLNPSSKPHPFLRDTLAYKQTWLYYLAIVADPILRFNWIFYAIFADDIQHSAILSFAVSLSEVFRRGLWMLFRVENEHCTNVGRFRASRDVPLPYETQQTTSVPAGLQDHLPQRERNSGDRERHISDTSRTTTHTDVEAQNADTTPLSQGQSQTSGADLGRQATAASSVASTLRWRRRTPEPSPLIVGLQRVGTALHLAHAQDFERKRKPELGEQADESDEGEDLETTSGYNAKIREEDESEVLEARDSIERGAERTSDGSVQLGSPAVL